MYSTTSSVTSPVASDPVFNPATFRPSRGPGVTVVDALPYQRWIDASPPWLDLPTQTLGPTGFSGEYIQVGDFGLARRVLPTYLNGRRVKIQLTPDKEVTFSEDVSIPTLFEIKDPQTVWMSLTPAEVLTCRPGIVVARGRVAVFGLGLGWQTHEILKKKTVEHVDVFDINQDLLDAIGPSLQQRHGERVRLHLGDFCESRDWSRYDTAIVDIWQGLGDCAEDEVFHQHKRLAPNTRFWGWGEDSR